MNLLSVLQRIDRRYIYAALMLSIMFPLAFLNIIIPGVINPPTRMLYDKVQNLPPGSFVMVGVDWSAGSRGENGAQTEAILRHLMRQKLRFALLAFDPQGTQLAEEIALRIEKKYHRVEGVDWVNWGYKVDQVNFLKSFCHDIPRMIQTDIHHVPIANLPVMAGIKQASDIKLLIDITPSATYQNYIDYMAVPFAVPMAVAPTAVMAPEAFNYLDSGQLIGLLNGLQGAIEYEQLIHDVGKATHSSIALSFSHLLIIFFILLGNTAMFLERKSKARRPAREQR